MKYLFIQYPKCSTCKKAKKWLDENGIEYETRHIVENNPDSEELKKWIDRSGLPIKSFFNTSGMLYREMKLKDLLSNMTDGEKVDILSSDGMLVKRPLLVGENTVLVGFKELEWNENLN